MVFRQGSVLLAALLIAGGARGALTRKVAFFESAKPAVIAALPQIVIPRAAGAIVIDGDLSDAGWKDAALIEGFRMRGSVRPAARKSAVRLAYDDRNLYVAVSFQDEDTGKLNFAAPKGADTYAGHMAELWLDPSHDRTGAGMVHLCLNPVGTRYDEKDSRAEWAGQWKGKGQVGPREWILEIAAPFSDFGLPGPPEGQSWGLNVGRLAGPSARELASWTSGWGAAREFGCAWFGSIATNIESIAWMPEIALALDREEYDPLDVTGIALVKLKRLPAGDAGAVRQVAVRLELLRGGKPVQTETIAPIPKENIDITLNTASFSEGAYTLRATLLGADGRELAKSERPLRKLVKRKQTAEPDTARVPLTVWGMENAGGDTYPVCAGVPFPQGALSSAGHARLLDDKEKEVPCQFSTRSLWNREGSVQWLGLDFSAAFSATGTTYFVEYGKAVRRAEPPAPLKVAETMDNISIDTGCLRFTVKKRGFNLIDEAYLKKPDGTEIPAARQDPASGLVVVDHEGTIYKAANDARIDIRIEEQGPFKVVIRAEGWYVKDGAAGESFSAQLPTDRLCRHVTRLTAWAGKPYVQAEHVWIATFDSRKVRVKNIGIGLKPAEAEKVALALDGEPAEYAAGAYPSVRLYQRSFDLAELETDGPELRLLGGAQKWKAFGEDAKALSKSGSLRAPGKAAGWATLAGKAAGITVFIRDLRQLYPKELECADGRLWAHIWPRHGRQFHNVNATSSEEIYKLWWCHEGEELDFQMPRRVFDALTEYGNNPGYSWAGMFANAMGVGAQTQLLIWFHPAGAGKDEARRLHDLFQLEPHARPDPQWTCDSLAFGYIFPRDDANFPEIERYFEFAFKRNCFLMDRAQDYGMFNYRDYHNGYYTRVPDDKWKWGTYRVWESTHYGHNKAILQMYARTGDPFYFQEARRNARHLMNVDVVQYHDGRADLFEGWKLYGPLHYFIHQPGGSYHAKGFVHWGGDMSIANHYSNFDYFMWHYFLHGDRRAREVALRWADEIKKMGKLENVGDRGGHAPATSLLNIFKATQDAGLLAVVDDFQLRFFADFIKINAADPHNSYNFAPFFPTYLDYAGNEAARRLLPQANEALRGGSYGQATDLAAAAYHDRKDGRFLPYFTEGVFRDTMPWDSRGWEFEPRDSAYGSYYRWGYAVRYFLPFLMAARDQGLPIVPPASQEQQAYPPSSYICFRQEAGKSVRLANKLADARKNSKAPIDVRLFDRLEGNIVRVVKIQAGAKPGEGAELAAAGAAARVQYGGVCVSSPDVLLPVTDAAQEMIALPPGKTVRITKGVWYFRAAPDQREIALNWTGSPYSASQFIQIRTGDRSRALISLVDSGEIRLPAEPAALYCIISSNGELASPERPLYVARRPEDLFDVDK